MPSKEHDGTSSLTPYTDPERHMHIVADRRTERQTDGQTDSMLHDRLKRDIHKM